MFTTVLANGKVKYQERYKDIMTGKWKTVSVTMDKDTASTRKLAAAELARRIDDKECRTMTQDLTLKQLYDLYITEQSKNLKASTMSRNRLTVWKTIELLGQDVLVDMLSATYVREHLKSIDTLKQREYITRFKAMLNWGYNNELINNHTLIAKLKLPADTSRKERIADKYLEPDELSALLDAMAIQDHKLLTKFLVLSGLRIGEAIALTPSDINDKYISVSKTYDYINKIITAPKTATSERNVFIQPELKAVIREIKIDELQKQLLYQRKSALVFSHPKTGSYISYDAYRQYLGDISDKAINRRITPHALRHTHASLLLAEGIDIDSISRRLGHNNSKVTKEIYIHMTEKLKQSEEEKLSKINLL
ncbi:MAG: site-specific integrase [Clostridium sp.]|nr:site-specific integrase [Clostridium sp.]MCM1461044.1 site-specific integrase [Bacteroides sp.]